MLSRLTDTCTSVPSWTGFNILTRNEVEIRRDKISYLPTINAPATEMATVFEILNQSQMIRKELQLPSIICVFDQALYAKASEIVWKHTKDFEGIILRMGDFHAVLNFLSVFGKRFKDAGLGELAVESGIIVEGSVQAVLEGRQYNRGVRLHKLVYEALLRLAWKEVVPLLKAAHPNDIPELEDAISCIEAACYDLCQTALKDILTNPSVAKILNYFETFLDSMRDGSRGELAAFWMSYIDMVEIMLGLIRASREGELVVASPLFPSSAVLGLRIRSNKLLTLWFSLLGANVPTSQ